MVKEWFRKIPHLGYGKCGGRNRDCSPTPPKDWMDEAFRKHDLDLAEATTPIQKLLADKKLAKALREGDPKELKIWGRIYRRMAMLVFR